jgi:uncharacterized protein (DUF302 family)
MEHLASGNIKSEHEKEMIMHGFGTTLDASFDDAIDRVTKALGKAGFGILTDIDVKASLERVCDSLKGSS